MTAKSFEVKGDWWLPESPERKVKGILRFNSESGSDLSLFGSLGSGGTKVAPGISLGGSGVYSRIHGWADRSSWTLEDCFATKTEASWPRGTGNQEVHVNSIVKGALLEAKESLQAEAIQVDMAYMPVWFDLGNFDDDISGQDYRLLFKARPPSHAVLSDGSTLSILHGASITGDDVLSRTMRQEYRCLIRYPSLYDFPDLIEVASDLQDLISIGAGQTAEFQAVVFRRSDLHQVSLDGTVQEYEQDLHLHARWSARDLRDAKKPFYRSDLLFSYTDIGEVDGIKRWLDVASEYRAALGRVMATQYNRKDMFISDRLLNCAAAVEGFSRTGIQPSSGSLRQHLERCVGLAGAQYLDLIGHDIAKWSKAVAFHRNDVAHHLGRAIERDSPDQTFLADSLYWLLIFCLLRKAQMPEDVFEKITNHRRVRWLAPKIQAAVAATL